MATLDDIARELGVSKSTVSKALSGAKDVSKSMRQTVLEKAVELGLKRVVFPSISTGTYHFPVNLAANTAVQTILDFLKNDSSLEEVSLICLDERTTLVYDMCLAQLQR
jgi:O-acetyl-ADP-ribose deacetylase (regulator of RNase III)